KRLQVSLQQRSVHLLLVAAAGTDRVPANICSRRKHLERLVSLTRRLHVRYPGRPLGDPYDHCTVTGPGTELFNAHRRALVRRGPVLTLLIVFLGGWLGAATASRVGAQEYTIRPGDVLKISVWGQDDLSKEYPVDDDGFVPFPLVGRVKA